MSQADFYALLEVDSTADEATIRTSYRRLALQLHPDRNPGDEQAGVRFKEITEAYTVLSDPGLRTEYDRMKVLHPTEALVQDVAEIVDGLGIFLGAFQGAQRHKGKKLKKDACPGCCGEGQLRVELGPLAFMRTCPFCEGSGKEKSPSKRATGTT